MGSIARTKRVLRALERVLVGGYVWCAKGDIKKAYKTIGTAGEDLYTHVIRVCNPVTGEFEFYISLVHVFGSRSAGAGFCRVSNALMWVVAQVGYNCDGYVDDSLHLEVTRVLCAGSQLFMELLCKRVNCPQQESKRVAACQLCMWLGFEFDMVARQIRIPAAYLAAMRESIVAGLGNRSWLRVALQSLIGRMARAAACVWGGSLYVFHLRAALRGKEQARRVNLGAAAVHELQWWLDVATRWNGVHSCSAPRGAAGGRAAGVAGSGGGG